MYTKCMLQRPTLYTMFVFVCVCACACACVSQTWLQQNHAGAFGFSITVRNARLPGCAALVLFALLTALHRRSWLWFLEEVRLGIATRNGSTPFSDAVGDPQAKDSSKWFYASERQYTKKKTPLHQVPGKTDVCSCRHL